MDGLSFDLNEMVFSSGTFQTVIASYKIKGKIIQDDIVTEFKVTELKLSNIPMNQSLPSD
jgi:hypothetical protein